MAQSTRRTVKWITLTIVLVAAGAGAYHVTSGGGAWFSQLLGRGERAAELTAEDASVTPRTAPSPSELDAVASAWGMSALPTTVESSTPVAGEFRSYDHQVKAARYAASADDAEGVNEDDSQKYVAASARRNRPAREDDRYGALDATPAMLPSDDEQAVTRGQEPSEIAASGGDEPDNPDSPPSEEEPPYDASSQRARDAFRDVAAIAADDRYGGALSQTKAERSASFDPRSVGNPFATPPAAAPADTPASQPVDSYSPSATRTGTAGASLSAIDEPESILPAELANDLPQTGPIRFARAANTDASPDDGTSQPPQPLRDLPDAATGSGQFTLPSGPSLSTIEGTGRPGERSLEGPQKPALVIQKFAPSEIQVGKSAKFKVLVRNIGGQTADDVVIRDEVPHGTRLVSTTPPADSEGSHLVWRLGALSTGEERTVEIELLPTAEGEIGSVASVSYAAQASARTRCTMPQLAIRMTAPSTVMIGHQQRVKIELRNPGTGDATGVMMFENVPENVRHVGGPSLEFEIGTLRAGETRELELVLTAEKSGHVVNVLQARADGNLQVQQQIEFEVIAPELLVGIDGPQRRYLERPATYQVSVENPGTAPAHDIELVTKLPKGMRFVRANNMGEYDAGTHAVYWSLAELPKGERGTVEFVAMPFEPGQQTLAIEGKARQGLSDATKQDVMVEGLVAIMFELRDKEDPVEVGRETTYEIRVVNQGTKAASNVQVVVSLPPGMQVVSATGETRYAAKAGGVVFEPLAQLAPKADSVYRVQVKAMQPGDQRVTVQVNTDDISQPIRREESTRVFDDQ